MFRIEIVRKNKEKNTKETYDFAFFENHNSLSFVLDRYNVSTIKPRATTAKYSRLEARYSTLTEEQVIIPEDVKEEVMKKAISALKVIKWSEYKR